MDINLPDALSFGPMTIEVNTGLNNELVRIQEWRCSVKKFDASKSIPAPTWAAIEKALILSPSSFGLQPWKFYVITDKDVRKKLTPLSWSQTQVEDCSHLVVFTHRNSVDATYVQKYVDDIIKTRQLPADKVEGFKQMMLGFLGAEPNTPRIKEWAARQIYIALGNFMTSAAMVGVDTCPMEGIDPPKYDEVLGIAGTGYSTLVACAAGYRHPEDFYSKLAKVRFSPADLVVKI